MNYLLNSTVKVSIVVAGWPKCVIVNVHKGKDDALKHGNHRSLKFLNQSREVVVFEKV